MCDISVSSNTFNQIKYGQTRIIELPKTEYPFAYKYFAPLKHYHNEISWIGYSITKPSVVRAFMSHHLITTHSTETIKIVVLNILENDKYWLVPFLIPKRYISSYGRMYFKELKLKNCF